MRISVIGAGPAGLTAAYELTKAGANVDVYEASDAVGGMARSLELWGQTVDLGPHRFFSSDARVNRLWLEVVGQDFAMVNRLTRIYYRGRLFDYPLKAFDALSKLGLLEAIACTASYAMGQLVQGRGSESFEDWVVRRFGRRLFNLFFKTYSEKLWGIPCAELDADFAAQRIKKLSLFEAIKSALFKGAGARHRTLLDQFAYPVGGTGMVYQRMAEFVERGGGTVHRRQPIQRVVTRGGQVIGIELADGGFRPSTHVVSSMPLTALVARLEGAPEEALLAAQQLSYRNTVLVYLNIDSANLFPDQWLYIHAPDLKVGRVTNFRNWAPQLHGAHGSSILALEYWCNDDEALWSGSKAQLVQLATDELRATGLIGQARVLDGHVERVQRSYPVYRRGYRKLLQPIETFVSGVKGLTAIGRYGAFKYNNQDHSILMGLLAAQNIAHGARHDLWRINTDYESYQEEAIITQTGLVPRPSSHESLPRAA